jgi:hypothetical protein
MVRQTAQDLPDTLKAYTSHGLTIRSSTSGKNVYLDCPFCDGQGKFSVLVSDGRWRCVRCNIGVKKDSPNGGGNIIGFLKLLWENGKVEQTEYADLTKDRGLLYGDTLKRWGVRRSIATGEWLIPGHSPEGKLQQIYRYVTKSDGKKILLATPGIGHQLHGMHLYDQTKPTVYITEGPWDAKCLWEVLKSARQSDRGDLLWTESEKGSLLEEINVIAVPGAGVFNDKWLQMFHNKRVVFFYDNDHPKKNKKTGSIIEPVGYASMRRAAQLLAGSDHPPSEIVILKWGNETTPEYDPTLPSGYDLRDYFAQGKTIADRVALLGPLFDKAAPMPDEWVPGRTVTAKSTGGVEIECLTCTDWKTLTTAWRKAMKWTDGLECGLATMLAVVTSTKSVGDQLWAKVIGPPSSGKTTLAEALAVNRQYTRAISTFTGLYSGYKTDKEGSEDKSLMAQIKDMTLIVKDGDTLLQQKDLPKILAELRDAYDGNTRTYFKNGTGREYENHRITFLLLGTGGLKALDSSELGERYLECKIMDEIDDELEREIMKRNALKAVRNVRSQANGTAESNHDPVMLKAYQLTGGYVRYLRENAERLLKALEIPDWALDTCTDLALFVAHMRARPSKKQEEVVEREMATRLQTQLIRLATCMSVAMSKKAIDDQVMTRVRKIALDTARGKTMLIAEYLYACGEEGSYVTGIAYNIHDTDIKTKPIIQFLRRLKVLEPVTQATTRTRVSSRVKWRLTDKFKTIYEACVKPDGRHTV